MKSKMSAYPGVLSTHLDFPSRSALCVWTHENNSLICECHCAWVMPKRESWFHRWFSMSSSTLKKSVSGPQLKLGCALSILRIRVVPERGQPTTNTGGPMAGDLTP